MGQIVGLVVLGLLLWVASVVLGTLHWLVGTAGAIAVVVCVTCLLVALRWRGRSASRERVETTRRVAWVVCAGALAVAVWAGSARVPTLYAFSGYASRYIAIAKGQQSVSKPADSRRGALVAIDSSSGRVDPAMFSLPADIRATSPSHVGTVVIIERSKSITGRYTGGGAAEQHVVRMTLIDPLSGEIKGAHTLYGPAPPTTIRVKPGRGAMGDEIKTEEIARWLLSLPAMSR